MTGPRDRAPVRELTVVDYHTEGEPMRIVTGGAGPIPGATLMERSEHLARAARDLVGFVLYEPRGHAAMCGAILTPPVTPGADAGVLFIEPAGPVHMCGHGAMAVAAMLADASARTSPVVTVALDTPAGLVECRVERPPGGARTVTLRNVPSFSVALDRRVDVPGLGDLSFDLAYGGHFYAIVSAAQAGLRLEPTAAARIVETGERVRAAIEAQAPPLAHPDRPGTRGLLYVQFTEPARRPDARYRNAVVVAPAGLDRSPCGTGTSARMASLHARGALAVGEPFGHESVIGTLFSGRIIATCAVGGIPAVVPEITGRAFLTGRGILVLDPDDPFPGGFLF